MSTACLLHGISTERAQQVMMIQQEHLTYINLNRLRMFIRVIYHFFLCDYELSDS